MEVITIIIKGLKASAGMVLTNGEAYSDPGETIYFGVNDSHENWHEITEEEYNRIKAEEEKAIEANI